MSRAKAHKVKDIFVEGPIGPAFIATSIAKHATRMDIGAHEIFLGQVRADTIDGCMTKAIEYTAYREMALERMTMIREDAFVRWPTMTCLHVHHSLGVISAGELCFMVFASAPHRQPAREAVAWVVDRIKRELPIFGKEMIADGGHAWKENR
ncbi:MAG: molybdenum cofactor biosynthesis protein MoaE [Flavobacteriales bacterium]|jgi:molybdopterin synthase catalytic subunit|nr:molybdenum cofactor biosynthesis protein MoaE [Flavobacteriales bacterium]